MLIIEKNKIKVWLAGLSKKTAVFAPMRREIRGATESVFEKFYPDMKIDFEYLPTLRSAKEFFLPAEENIFIFDKSKRQVKTSTPNTTGAIKNFILFGLNSRDLEAITQLDAIMTESNPDFFYFEKRNSATIIGLINEPLNIPGSLARKATAEGDLVLAKINENQYHAIPLTQKGEKIAKNKIFKNETAIITNQGSQVHEVMPKLRELLRDPELLADAVKWSWKNDYSVWEELSNLCLGCGICAYVCPLCYCFSIDNGIALDGKTCSRCRSWDACTLPRFSQISGGFNFHKTIKERYYNWYFHKFVRAYKEYGKSQCVACGRCQKYCPAQIDIEKYLLRIVGNYKKAMGLS